jgi:iron complex transport system ATP-binding protein
MNVLSVRDIGLRYGSNAVLQDLSFEVKAGEFFVVIGPNGSGKTTLLKILARLLKPGKGEIDLLGRSLASYDRRELSQAVALVPQQMPLDFPFSVQETVLMGRSPYLGLLGVEGENDLVLARQAMEFTDVYHLAERRLDQLSGGERQRVIIARAICQQPQVILLDEPTAALDPAHQVHVMDLMERFREERGITVVMVSHDLNLAALYGNRLLLINEGRSVIIGSPAEVLTEEILSSNYGCTMQVYEKMIGQSPFVMPTPAKYQKKNTAGS